MWTFELQSNLVNTFPVTAFVSHGNGITMKGSPNMEVQRLEYNASLEPLHQRLLTQKPTNSSSKKSKRCLGLNINHI